MYVRQLVSISIFVIFTEAYVQISIIDIALHITGYHKRYLLAQCGFWPYYMYINIDEQICQLPITMYWTTWICACI